MDVPQSRAETKKEGYSIQVVNTVYMLENRERGRLGGLPSQSKIYINN